MPRVESTVVIPVDVETAFAVSQTSGETRLRWDPFISGQRFLDGAERAASGVRSETRSRHGLTMVTEYTSFRPPRQVGMRMVSGPWFFLRFGSGWSFVPEGPNKTRATWRYTFTVRPAWLAPVADRLGQWLLGRDIRRRIDAFANACLDPEIVAEALGAQYGEPESP